MTYVACFCDCCFSFDGDAAACPRCGEVASVTADLALDNTGRSQPKIPVPAINGIGQEGRPQAFPDGPKPAPCPAAQPALFMTAVSSPRAGHYPRITGTAKGAS
jgi:hypothetical protein